MKRIFNILLVMSLILPMFLPFGIKKAEASSQPILSGFENVWVSPLNYNVVKSNANPNRYSVQQFVIKRISDGKLFFGFNTKAIDLGDYGAIDNVYIDADTGTSLEEPAFLEVKDKNGNVIPSPIIDDFLSKYKRGNRNYNLVIYPASQEIHTVKYYGNYTGYSMPSQIFLSQSGYNVGFGQSFNIIETNIGQYLNQLPVITLTIPNQKVFSLREGYNILNFKGTVSDTDSGDYLNIKTLIDGTEFELGALTANGTDQTFEKDLTLNASLPFQEGNNVLKIWVEDDKGGKNEQNFNFVLDKTAPSIGISNINEGQLFVNEVTPYVTITDVHNYNQVATLNGEPYVLGTPITESGTNELVITATDEVGNSNSKTVNFTINRTPILSTLFTAQTLKKFETVELDLTNYFTDSEDDPLTFTASSSNENVTATVNGNILTIEAKKQGSSTITVSANDGHSTSSLESIQIGIETRVPVLTLNPTHIIVDDASSVELKGTVNDGDKEAVSITGEINGVSKTTNITETTGNEDSWSLTWNGTEIGKGVYSGFSVTSQDGFDGLMSSTYPKAIIKVDDVGDYQNLVDSYANDLEKTPQDLTVQEHQHLFDANEAITLLSDSNTPSTLADAEGKVNALQNGSVKSNYQAIIQEKAYGYLLTILNTATVQDYERAGLTNIISSNVSIYQSKSVQYKNDIETHVLPFIKGEFQKLIDTQNELVQAQQDQSISSWLDAKRKVELLVSGTLKNETLTDIENNIITILKNDPTQLTSHLLTDELGVVASSSREAVYRIYLTDIVNGITTLTKNDLQDLVTKVDEVISAYSVADQEPNRTNIDELVNQKDSLTTGTFKAQINDTIKNIGLKYLVASPEIQDETDLDRLGITYTLSNLFTYQTNLKTYIQDVGSSSFNQADIQKLVTATDKYLIAVDNPTDQNIQDALTTINELKANSSMKNTMLDELTAELVKYIADNPSTATENQFKNAGFTGVNAININEYQQALTQYTSDKQGELNDPQALLERTDIQNVINVINKIVLAENDQTTDSINLAFQELASLNYQEIGLSVSLKNRVVQVAVGYLKNNPSTVTQEEIERIGITDLTRENLNLYQKYFGLNPTGLTKELIQDVVGFTNTLPDVLTNYNSTGLQDLKDLVTQMASSSFKNEFMATIDTIESMTVLEKNLDDLSLQDVKNKVALLNNVTVKNQINDVVLVMESVIKAKDDLTTGNIDEAIAKINQLPNGSLKDRLLVLIGDYSFGYVSQNPSTVDISDLTRAGLQNINADLIEEYRLNLAQYTTDLGQPLTRTDVQLVIDVTNIVALAATSNQLQIVNNAITLSEELHAGELKNRVLSEMNSLKKRLTPSSPTVPKEEPKPSKNEIVLTNNSAELNVKFKEVVVSSNDSINFNVNLKAKQNLEDAEIQLYYLKEADNKVLAFVQNLLNTNGKEVFHTIKVGSLKAGETYDIEQNVTLEKEGEYNIGAVLIDKASSFESDNIVTLKITNNGLKIPNIDLPTNHNQPIARIYLKEDTELLKEEGNELKVYKILPKGDTYNVYGVEGNKYHVGGGYYIQKTGNESVHIARTLIKGDVPLYSPDGKVYRTLKKGEAIRVYSYDDNQYEVGGGYYIKKERNAVFYEGYLNSLSEYPLYSPDGKIVRDIHKNESIRVYSIDGDHFYVGGGYYVINDKKKNKFIRH